MLKTSLFNKGIYKSQLARFKWGSLLYFVILFFTTSFVLIINDYSHVTEYTLERYLNSDGIILCGDYITFPILFATVVPTVVSFLVFDMFSSKRQSVFIHSLPCSRNSIYISTLLGAFTLMSIPVIANTIILMLISVFKLSELYTVLSCLKWAATNLILIFIMFSVSVFSASLTANRVSMVFINALLHLLPLIIAFGSGGVASVYLYGFNENFNSFIDKAVEWMPITFAWVYNNSNDGRFVENILSNKGLIFVIGASVIYLLGLILYRKRNNENAGNFVAFRIMQPIFKYTITAIGVVIAFSTLHLSGFERGFYMFFLLAVISLILYFASEMILKKNLKVFKAYKGYLIFALACFIVNAFMQFSGFFGYEKRIPDAFEVDSVAIYTDYTDEKPFTNDKDVITDAIKYHNEIILNIPDIIKRDENSWGRINIEYNLKNGKSLIRTYTDLSVEEKVSIMSGLYENDAYKLASDNVHKLDTDKIDYIRLSFEASNNYSYNFGIEGKNNIDNFLSAWEKDILSLGYEEKAENTIMYLSIDYERDKEESYKYVHKGFNPNYKNTIKFLEDNGYFDEIYKLDSASIFISKSTHSIETKTYDNITRLYFDDKVELAYTLDKNEVTPIDSVDKELIIKDVFKGRLKKNSDDGNKFILYVLDENTETFERYTMFLTIDKENLPDYLLKYVQ